MASALFDLSGQVAVITGASRGIGLSIAEEMGRAGSQVVLSSNDVEALTREAERLRAEGIEVLSVPCDVADRAQLQELASRALAWRGRIDVLVCNAGVAPPFGPLAAATDADWDLTMTVNLRSMMWLTGLLIPQMAERRGGSVILTCSIASVRGNKALGLYALSKAGVAQLARNLAVEWGPCNVRVNAISPGVIQTEFSKPLTENPEVLARRVALTPLRRVGLPHEVAGLAVLLAGSAGAFITGQNLIVDGGTVISDGN